MNYIKRERQKDVERKFPPNFNWNANQTLVIALNILTLELKLFSMLPGWRNSHRRFKTRSEKLGSIQNKKTRRILIRSCESIRVGRSSTRPSRSGLMSGGKSNLLGIANPELNIRNSADLENLNWQSSEVVENWAVHSGTHQVNLMSFGPTTLWFRNQAGIWLLQNIKLVFYRLDHH